MSQKLFQIASELLSKGQHIAYVTVLSTGGSTPRSSGTRMIVLENGEIRGTVGGGNVEHLVIKAAVKAIQEKQPTTLTVHLTRDLGMCCGGEMTLHIDPISPNIDIVIFGAGHVAHALASILRPMDVTLTVIDDRFEYNNSERFPEAELILEDGLRFAEQYASSLKTYFLVVTHDHQRDQELIERLLSKQMAWLGLIGSRSKVAKFFIRFRAAGIPESYFQKLSAPVGLDIGAETPTEIAISIAAEIIRVRRGQRSTPVSLSEIPIPARGGDGVAIPPGLSVVHQVHDPQRSEDQ